MSRAVTGQAGRRDRLKGRIGLPTGRESLATGMMRPAVGAVVLATGAVYARIASLPSFGFAAWRPSVDCKPAA
jgi:hypothetical protein